MKSFVVLFLAASTACAQNSAPEAIFFDGIILTGSHLSPDDTSLTPALVTALAITHGVVVAAGADTEILKLKGPHTELIDLHGAFAMPGFNDAHTHIASAGQQELTVDLDNTQSLAEMQDRIKTYTAKQPAGAWIVGSGWDHTKWPSRTLPTRQDLDAVTANHPALFYRTDGHILVANSAALLTAGVSSATPDPDGGKIDHDASGTPTGIIREAPAIALLSAKIPNPSPELRRQALEIAIADALAHGVTSVQDFSDWGDWLLLESMERSGKLNLRISEWLPFDLPLAVLQQRRASHDPDDPLLHLGMLKAFMDGSLGSRTAALAEPYTDDPTNLGLPRYSQAKLNQLAAERAAAGFQLGFHAIGDEANTLALNAFTAAERVSSAADQPVPANADATIVTAPATPRTGLRFRVEHAQVLLPEDFDRFQTLGVIASMQPSHLLTDMAWASARLGPERSKYAYAWRSMLSHHIPLAFGTDYPVESIDPFRGLYAATTRKNIAETQTFHPEQTISLNQAILAYTQTSAFAEFRETTKGRLEPGFLADLVVLNQDITRCTPAALLQTKVVRTVVGGRTVYPAEPVH